MTKLLKHFKTIVHGLADGIQAFKTYKARKLKWIIGSQWQMMIGIGWTVKHHQIQTKNSHTILGVFGSLNNLYDESQTIPKPNFILLS